MAASGSLDRLVSTGWACRSGVALGNPGRAGRGTRRSGSTRLDFGGLAWLFGVWEGYLNNKVKHSGVDG